MRVQIHCETQLLGGSIHPHFFGARAEVHQRAAVRGRENSGARERGRGGACAEADFPLGRAGNLIVERVVVRRSDGRERAIARHRTGQRNRAGAGRRCRFQNTVADDECH